MGCIVRMRVAALGAIPALTLLAGCTTSYSPPASQVNAAPPRPAVPISTTAPRFIRRFSGIPMPPNNVLDVDRTVVVGGDSDWVGRIFFAAPMTADQAIEFYRHDMPRYGWTELAVTRSQTSVLAYEMGHRLATIELTPRTSVGGTQIEFWVNPIGTAPGEQAARRPEPFAPATAAVPSSLPRGQADGAMIYPIPPRAVEQSPLPPP